MSERVVENLNRALLTAMQADERVWFIGEDVLDPYGGAFKAARGLSTKFPTRVLSTPISELGLAGVANGLALAGQRPVVEFMFGDFIFLAADQIINFAAKTVSMYGRREPHHIIFRCPYGGHRGYGATHSQTPQKHFIGVPNLDLYELSPLHDAAVWLPRLLDAGQPAILCESKTLYARDWRGFGEWDDIFTATPVDADGIVARIGIEDQAGVTLITHGGMAETCAAAARTLLIEAEIEANVLVPFRLYPVPVEEIATAIPKNGRVFVIEESTAGGTWGAEVAAALTAHRPDLTPRLIHSADAIIPSARHLERRVLVQADDVVQRVRSDQ